MAWLKTTLITLAALAAVAAALIAWGTWRWQAATRTLVQQLDAARVPPGPTHYDSTRELPGLPEPVQRYFRTVLTEGQPMVAAVTLQHRGSFNMGATQEQWKPFTSWQRSVTRRPGFVWDGRIAVVPGLAVHVHDAYVAGQGILRPAVAGLFTLLDLRDASPEPGGVAHGELMRFVAEAAWYPTALLPSQGVRWQALDARSARATLADGELTLTLTFEFASDGTMARVRADARGRTVGDHVLLTPWEGVWSDMQLQAGMRVPMRGEVAWLTPQGRLPYWRGTVSSLDYEFAAAR
jgi:hypothetical protein